jgi:hypothetical protein
MLRLTAVRRAFYTHFGSIVHFNKPKRYDRNAFLLPVKDSNGNGIIAFRKQCPSSLTAIYLYTSVKPDRAKN